MAASSISNSIKSAQQVAENEQVPILSRIVALGFIFEDKKPDILKEIAARIKNQEVKACAIGLLDSSKKSKAIYNGIDTRLDMFFVQNPLIPDATDVLRNADASIGLVWKKELISIGDQGYYFSARACTPLHQFIFHNYGEMYGESEPFYDQPTACFGSGFLVGDQLVATAGHCVWHHKNYLFYEVATDRVDITKIGFVFRYQMTNSNTAVARFSNNDVFFGRRIIACKYHKVQDVTHSDHCDDQQDWALVELDRPVAFHRPANLSLSEKVSDAAELYVLGHPSGLPLKLAHRAQVRDNSHPNFFTADLDTFAGNSGSPVYDRNLNSVVGILVGGQTDYEIDDNYQFSGNARVVVSHIHNPYQSGFESVQRITDLGKAYFEYMQNLLSRSETVNDCLDIRAIWLKNDFHHRIIDLKSIIFSQNEIKIANGPIAIKGKWVIKALSTAPINKHSSGIRKIVVLDLNSNQSQSVITDHQDRIGHVKIRDNMMVSFSHYEIGYWDLLSMKCQKFIVLDKTIRCLDFNDKYLVVSEIYDGLSKVSGIPAQNKGMRSVKIYDLPGGALRKTIDFGRRPNADQAPYLMLNSNQLVIIDSNGAVDLIDLNTLTTLKQFNYPFYDQKLPYKSSSREGFLIEKAFIWGNNLIIGWLAKDKYSKQLGWGGGIGVIDIKSGQLIQDYPYHRFQTEGTHYSPPIQTAILGSNSTYFSVFYENNAEKIRFLDPNSGKMLSPKNSCYKYKFHGLMDDIFLTSNFDGKTNTTTFTVTDYSSDTPLKEIKVNGRLHKLEPKGRIFSGDLDSSLELNIYETQSSLISPVSLCKADTYSSSSSSSQPSSLYSVPSLTTIFSESIKLNQKHTNMPGEKKTESQGSIIEIE